MDSVEGIESADALRYRVTRQYGGYSVILNFQANNGFCKDFMYLFIHLFIYFLKYFINF